MARLYRVEDAAMHGPFTSMGPTGMERAGMDTLATNRRPMPYADGITLAQEDSLGSRARYAFHSLDHLRQWFNSYERARLMRAGYRVGLYDVPDHAIVRGVTQAIFDVSQAQRVGALSLLKL